MSWRAIVFFLLVTAGFSAWGGISLGNWLVAHGPEAPPIPELLDSESNQVLDADGNPYVAQPPQPLVSGHLGTPEPSEHIVWEIQQKSLAHERAQIPIAIGTTTITMADAQAIAQSDVPTTLDGIANVGDLLSASGAAHDTIQPIDVPDIQPAPSASSQAATQGDWQQALRAEIEACKNTGFFNRPTCAWNARNKYCEPNNAWGKIPDCPSKQ